MDDNPPGNALALPDHFFYTTGVFKRLHPL
jgi:hypothetical protein